MGRDEEPGLARRGLAALVLREDGIYKGAGAAFAFCPCHVDYVETV